MCTPLMNSSQQYDWNAVTTGRLSEVSLDKTKGESLFQKILAADETIIN